MAHDGAAAFLADMPSTISLSLTSVVQTFPSSSTVNP